MAPEEALLWKSIQQKNTSAFEGFYKAQYKSYFMASFSYLNDTDLAQEVVNDVFMKIWEDAEKLVIETSLKSYVYRAVINRSLNVLAKQKREMQQRKELGYVQDESYELRQIEENELKIALYKAIDQLPDQCKRVFCMSRFDQLKQQEIADKLGISIKTVKNHITHALQELHKKKASYWLVIVLFLTLFFQTN